MATLMSGLENGIFSVPVYGFPLLRNTSVEYPIFYDKFLML